MALLCHKAAGAALELPGCNCLWKKLLVHLLKPEKMYESLEDEKAKLKRP